LETGEDIGDFGEGVEAIGAATEFAWSLRTAEEKNADEGGFGAGEVVGFAEPVLVFGNAAIGATGAAGETDVFKAAQGEVNFFLIEVGDGLAIGPLVTGVDQGVERERVVVGGGGFFFE
jgi:hypothetical protein